MRLHCHSGADAVLKQRSGASSIHRLNPPWTAGRKRPAECPASRTVLVTIFRCQFQLVAGPLASRVMILIRALPGILQLSSSFSFRLAEKKLRNETPTRGALWDEGFGNQIAVQVP